MEKDNSSDYSFDIDSNIPTDFLDQSKNPVKSDARRKVEDYRARRELERLINDDFDY